MDQEEIYRLVFEGRIHIFEIQGNNLELMGGSDAVRQSPVAFHLEVVLTRLIKAFEACPVFILSNGRARDIIGICIDRLVPGWSHFCIDLTSPSVEPKGKIDCRWTNLVESVCSAGNRAAKFHLTRMENKFMIRDFEISDPTEFAERALTGQR